MVLISHFSWSYYSNLLKTWWLKVTRIHSLLVWKSEAQCYLNFWVEQHRYKVTLLLEARREEALYHPMPPFELLKLLSVVTNPLFKWNSNIVLLSFITVPSFFLSQKNTWITYNSYSHNPSYVFSFMIFLWLTCKRSVFPYEVVYVDPRDSDLMKTRNCYSVCYMWDTEWRLLHKIHY